MSKQIPELTIITTPTAGQESLIETVVARHDTYATSRMTLAQIFTLGSISGSIKVALDTLSGLISGNTSSINTLSSTKLNIAGGTRTGLTAKAVVATDASGNEVLITGTLGQQIGFDVSNTPVALTPTVDVHGLTQKTIPVGADEVIISDSEASFVNKKSTIGSIVNLAKVEGGNGSDGALSISSGTTTIAFDASGYIEKNYTSFTMTGGTLTFSGPPANGGVVVIKVSGNFSMTGSSIIDASGMGGAGGGYPGYANGYGLPGAQGKHFLLFVNATNFGAAGGGATAAGGAALSSYGGYNAGYCGAGGGSGYIDTNHQGLGGRGGACIYIEVAGKFTFTTPAIIKANGAAGGTNNGGGGGGGGAGSVIIKAFTIITQTGSIEVNGGDGGSTLNGYACAGGGGSYAAGGGVTGLTTGAAGGNTTWGTGGTSGASKGGGGGAGFYKIN